MLRGQGPRLARRMNVQSGTGAYRYYRVRRLQALTTGGSLGNRLRGSDARGDGLRVGTLDTDKGIISVDGKINALYYTDSIKGRRGSFQG